MISAFKCQITYTNQEVFDGWLHLELGAGNYGQTGITNNKNIFTNFEDVSKYLNQSVMATDPEKQYALLFWTLDVLVNRYGKNGVFHINDLYLIDALYAAKHLKDYAKKNAYDSLIIEVIPGDYSKIDSILTLQKFGKAKYSSVHLKNPEIYFYRENINGVFF